MQEKFLDRDKETLEVSNIIGRNCGSSQILLLSGYSGVGKSGLMEKIMQLPSVNIPIIRIKISKNSVDTIENLQYFNAIYKNIVDYAKQKTFDGVLSPKQKGIKDIKNLCNIAWSLFKVKLGIDNALPLSEPEEDASLIRKKDYISYILQKNSIILDIENIQNIDTQSLEILKEIIRFSSTTTFVLEYTFSDEKYTHYQNFWKELKETGAVLHRYNIEKMDFTYVKKLVPQGVNIDEAALQNIFDKSNGNLMEVILYSDASIVKNSSNISVTIQQLSKNLKYILYIIFLNDSSIRYEELFSIVVSSHNFSMLNHIYITPKELDSLLFQLQDKKIIITDRNIIRFKHDSICSELKFHSYNPILSCAYYVLKEHYLHMLEKEPENSTVIERLLVIFLMFSDQDLLLILPNIKKVVLNCKYPQLIINKLDYFREKLKQFSNFSFAQTYNLTIMMVQICLNKKMAEVAQRNLLLIYDESNYYHVALQAQIYSMIETIESHDALEKLIGKIPENSRIRLIAEICFLYLKTKLLSSCQAKKYGMRLFENKQYKEYPEYGFLLRNFAELCNDNDKCIELYNLALQKFKCYNMVHDMASVYLSLSMIYSYKGDLSTARKNINTALELDYNNISTCYVSNNSAVIEILEGSYSFETEKKLLDSALLAVSRYENIIIDCNLLIYYCLTEQSNKAQQKAVKIENSSYSDFGYEEILHIVLQNLLFYYSVCEHNTERREYYYNQILNLINSSNVRETTRILACQMNHLQPADCFYGTLPYRVDFLGYWEFTIDNALDH